MASTVTIGQQLGRYEIVSELGQGGMSVVYRARDTRLERDVAVKVMHGFLAEQEEARERFNREAKAVARLHHAHIIEIFDVSGEDADQSYIVAELIEGQPLSKWLGESPVVPPEAGLVLARPVAAALVHAHKAGVIHRDLKPENILVSNDGSLKLTDFGIARMLDNQTMTMTGTLLGSPAYMAPEYIEGEETDARADIFSFGAMLYQFMTGKLPFAAPSPHALLKKIATGAHVPVNQENPAVHAAVARVVHRCLQKKPQDRFPNAKRMLAAIDRILDRLDIDADDARADLLQHREDYGARLRVELKQRYVDLGKKARKIAKVGQAMEDFDRVLSIDPNHTEVRKILDGLHRRRQGIRILRDGFIAVTTAAAITITVGRWMGHLADTKEPPRPEATEVVTPVPVRPRDVTFVIAGTARLIIDGKVVEESASGAVVHQLNPGLHSVSAVGDEESDEREFVVPEELNVAVLPVDLNVEPPPKPKDPVVIPDRLVELSTKHVVSVIVDEENAPRTVKQGAIETKTPFGVFKIRLTYGERRLQFISQYHKSTELRLKVSEDEPPTRVVVPTPDLKDALVRLEGGPPGIIDVKIGVLKKTLTDGNRDLPIAVPMTKKEEKMLVSISQDGFTPFETTLALKPGEQQNLAFDLVPR